MGESSRGQIIGTSFEKMTIIRKRKKKTKIADTGFKENYLTISWPNFSLNGSGAADLELKTYD